MRRIWSAVLIGLLLAAALTISAAGQEGNTDATGGTITVQRTLPISATVDIEINGQVIQLALPATITIDAQAALADALLAVDNINQIGIVSWSIIEIAEYTDTYVYDRFSEYEPSRGNKLIVVESDVTNLDSAPLPFYRDVEARGFDELGNVYDASQRKCDDLNPRATGSCTLIFDVAPSVEIIGLDLAVIDRKRLTFTPTE